MGAFGDLAVYKKAFSLSMEIYELTKSFPSEEKFGLVSQIRRSPRSVCACISESYRKRKYRAHFINKITGADMENTETQVWLEFSLKCKYILQEDYDRLISQSGEAGNH